MAGLRRCRVLLIGGLLRSGLLAGFIEDLDLLKCRSFFSRSFHFGGAKRGREGGKN